MDKHSEGFYEKVLENLHDCVFVCDTDGTTLYANKALEKFYGIKREEIIGKVGINFYGTNQCSESPVPLVLQTKGTVTMDQTTGVNRTVTITAVPVFGDQNEIEMIVENSRDITEIEHLRGKLKKLTEQAEQIKSAVAHLDYRDENQLIIAQSASMKKIMNGLKRISSVDSSVLLLGESGTGKSNIAKYIHSISHRKDGPFITINCSTIPESLFESELFGYHPGAFTGANKSGKIGLVELAHGGTLFLDEVGELPIQIQVKLLRMIQDHRFIPVGETKEREVDIRIIAATNQDLAALVAEKSFREDLYYRLKVVEIDLPPLRERVEDLSILIYYFLNQYDKKYKFSHSIDPQALELLTKYHWPGNVRELSNVIENLVVVVEEEVIAPHHLPPYMYSKNEYQYNISVDDISDLGEELEKLEKAIIQEAYKKHGTSYKVAAALGISQSQAIRKIRRYCDPASE